MAMPATAKGEETKRFTATGGRPIVVGIHPSVRDECTRGPLVDISLVGEPRNGTVSVTVGRVVVNPASACPSFDATAKRVTYRPNVSFTGEDRFSYRTTDGLGRVKLHTITVTVHGKPTPRVFGI
jgi:hypothetical protein